MGAKYRTLPTHVLERMWEVERDRLAGDKDAVVGDYDDLLAMRTELERRKDEPKPIVDVNFSKDYLTD